MADRYEGTIDYAGLAAALLARSFEFVSRWLPNGVERNGRWYVGDFDGADGESANVNLDTGTWIDNGGTDDDRGGDLISLYARIRGLSNATAARELMEELGWRSTPAPVRGATQPPAPARPAPPAEPRADVRTPQRGSKWRAIAPVPPHAPAPGFVFKFHDRRMDVWQELVATRTWEYRFEGELYGYVARFERIDSKGNVDKQTLPRTWCVDESDGQGSQRWHWKQWDAPRPLYVPAMQLSADLSRPVVLVEGEKCAEAGHGLLGSEFDFVTWPGGCKAWAAARWGWLRGRTVYLWPDADRQREKLTKAEREAGADPEAKPFKPADRQPGMQAMVGLGALLMADFGCTAYLCHAPAPDKALCDGWDIADAINQGWDALRVRTFIRSATEFVPVSDEARAKAVVVPFPQASAGAGEDDDSTAWRNKLLMTGKGAILPVRDNVVLALDGMALLDGRWLPGIPEANGVIAFNDFTNDVIKLKDTPWGTRAGIWDEADELELGNWLCRAHWLPPMSRQTLEEAVTMVARRHRYHPVRERFDALRGKWDGEKRLSTWLARCCRREGVLPDSDPLQQYLARVGTWTMMAICARVNAPVFVGRQLVRGPGCKFDYMMILEGGQGMGKSTLCGLLGMEWHADTGLVLGEKDSYQNLQGVLAYEWGELDSLTRAEVTKVKQFISSPKDRFRASFDKRPKDYPRQVVFIGTTNESHYLSDPTGNRRFWPVRVTRFIDLDWIKANLDQLYAEALVYLDAGDRFHPTSKEQQKLFDPQQLERTVENALESAIRRYLYDEGQKPGLHGINGALLNEITLADLLSALSISVDKQTNVLSKQASAALGRMGWERGRASGKGGKVRPWVYRRPPEQPEPAPGASDPTARPTQGAFEERATDDCPF